jgi:capsular polysaccharide biosynthesis protein
MELSAYISLFRRWLWLIMLCAVIAASVSFVAARTQPPRYQASTTVQVGAYSSLANPSAGMISTAEQLAQTYVALANTYPVLDAVAKKLRLDVAPDSLSRLFTTRLVSGTSLLTITVTYTDPVVAADIAMN